LAAPIDGYTPPNDTDIYSGSRNGRPSEPAGGKTPSLANGNGLIGPAGFILN
jgi:hypothetical protein